MAFSPFKCPFGTQAQPKNLQRIKTGNARFLKFNLLGSFRLEYVVGRIGAQELTHLRTRSWPRGFDKKWAWKRVVGEGPEGERMGKKEMGFDSLQFLGLPLFAKGALNREKHHKLIELLLRETRIQTRTQSQYYLQLANF